MIWNGQLARDIDQQSSAKYGVAAADLMEAAGAALAQMAIELWKPGLEILVAAGPGNNGGDAYVAARLLFEAGFKPSVLDIIPPGAKESSQRKTQKLEFLSHGLNPIIYQDETNLLGFERSTLLIDGVLGLGLKEPLKPGFIKTCLEQLACLQARIVLAVDMPSGMQADSWHHESCILPATHTITFGAAKLLHRLEPARSHCGQVRVVQPGFHPQAIQSCLEQSEFALFEDQAYLESLRPWLTLSTSAHKYTRGHVLVIGGSPGKCGAPVLSASASLRAGAGWASVALLVDKGELALPPQLTYENFAKLQPLDAARLLNFIKARRVKALVIGPGTMDNPLTKEVLVALHQAQIEMGLFLVFDAAALQDWSTLAQDLRFNPDRTLLTPHPGEWQRMNAACAAIEDLESLRSATAFCREFGVSVFYKTASPFTITVDKKISLLLNTDGNASLAKAGSGDVLAGVAAAMGCAGLSARMAGNFSQKMLAYAANKASQKFGRHGLQPEDLIEYLGQSLEE